jgi:hypothetical protein
MRRAVLPAARGGDTRGASALDGDMRGDTCPPEDTRRGTARAVTRPRGNIMRGIIVLIAGAVALTFVPEADAQGRRQDRRERQEIARAQGIPPGHMPPPDECRVWYDNRPPGRQPSPTDCSRAEAIAARQGDARVIYGVDVYRESRYGSDRWGGRVDDRRGVPENDRAVPRDGRVRDPRISGGILQEGRDWDRSRRSAPAFDNGYRDGLTKGREDAEDGDRFDVNRHAWYRSATRGHEDEYGPRAEYQARYRQGFEAGYAEGYRVYAKPTARRGDVTRRGGRSG